MRIMSFNTQHCLNYVERRIDFDIMARAIIDCDADVVGLNEMRGIGPDPEFEAQTERLAELTGMRYYYFAPALHMKEGLYGNALLSRIPIKSAKTIIIPDPVLKNGSRHYETRCILKAELEGGITLLITHFGLNSDEQKNAVDTVLESLAKEKCILMGDFNVTPECPVLLPIRAAMTDTANFFDEPKLSFPSDLPKAKIDYIFVSRDVAVKSADIPHIVASDHRPHTAEINL